MTGFVKICGVTDAPGMEAALRHGADFIGFVFRSGSARYVDFERAAKLARMNRARARIAAVVVGEGNDFLDRLVKTVNPDLLQLHGSEAPQRVSEIASRFSRPLIKALGIAGQGDLRALASYAPLCDWLLLEAKSPDGLPSGGSGRAFDWKLVRDAPHKRKLILAGGLTPENAEDAIAISGVQAVDVSSGVERAPGIKDEAKVKAFIHAARTAFAKAPAFGVPA